MNIINFFKIKAEQVYLHLDQLYFLNKYYITLLCEYYQKLIFIIFATLFIFGIYNHGGTRLSTMTSCHCFDSLDSDGYNPRACVLTVRVNLFNNNDVDPTHALCLEIATCCNDRYQLKGHVCVPNSKDNSCDKVEGTFDEIASILNEWFETVVNISKIGEKNRHLVNGVQLTHKTPTSCFASRIFNQEYGSSKTTSYITKARNAINTFLLKPSLSPW